MKLNKMVYDEHGTGTRIVETSGAERANFALDDDEVLALARWGLAIERHYGRPMDVEWAKDGKSGKLYILQARPETVQARHASAADFRSFEVKARGERLLTGCAIGDAVAVGHVCRLDDPRQTDSFEDGCILVTAMTDPDWVPLMQRAAAIVTDHGGRTSHAAIVSRELGLPAVTGTQNATRLLENDQEITVSCAEGNEGFVYAGRAEYEVRDVDLDAIPVTSTRVMLNVADPANALRWWRLPADGIGLARIEFIVANQIKCHPMALIDFDRIEDPGLRERIEEETRGYEDKERFFVETLSQGIARIAASVYPLPVIVRTSDFKTNEYADLIGGEAYEPTESNPMLGWRGASRYYHPDYEAGFALECRAIRRAREVIGLDNIIVMIPFCRTPAEGRRVIDVMAAHGLERGRDGLLVYAMCEVPSNAVLVEAFAEHFDGFSIGSNDLTQLVLGIDRDSDRLADLFSERDDAVMAVITDVIRRAHSCGMKVGLCGQGPSDHPDLARRLVQAGIDSLSVTPDSFVKVKHEISAIEGELSGDGAEIRRLGDRAVRAGSRPPAERREPPTVIGTRRA